MRFFVTTHALARWQMRAAEYADAGIDDVAKAANECRLVTDDESLPLKRIPGTTYYFHDATKCYFVCEAINGESARIVTVVNPDEKSNYLLPKRKKKKPMPDVADIPAEIPSVMGFQENRPEFANPEEEWLWHVRHLQGLQAQIVTIAKGDKRRKTIIREMTAITRVVGELRKKKLEWNKNRCRDGEVYRSDGSINYGPAIKFLLAKVEELESRLAERQEDTPCPS